MTPYDRLVALQDREIAAAQAAGEEFFLDLPDAWYEPRPTYGCESGHISHRYLKSEAQMRSLCLDCHKPLVLLPGRYTDETLTAALAVIE
jgi:hypothetical protein